MAVGQRTGGTRARGERGQSLVELALTIPVLLLLLVGVVEIGNALNVYMTVVDAGRDGARFGSKGSVADAQVRNVVVMDMDRLPNLATSEITVEHNVMQGGRPSIRVTVCYKHSLVLSVPLVMPNPLRMCSSTTMPTTG